VPDVALTDELVVVRKQMSRTSACSSVAVPIQKKSPMLPFWCVISTNPRPIFHEALVGFLSFEVQILHLNDSRDLRKPIRMQSMVDGR
jgi:hypothetical protein